MTKRDRRYRSAKGRARTFVPCNTCKPEFLSLQTRYESLLVEVDELRKLSITDPLTELHNRRILFTTLEKAVVHARVKKYELAVVAIDIDHFKSINDTYGHTGGDQVLVAFAMCLKSFCTKNDFVARMGGEEFVIIITNTEHQDVGKRVEKLRKKIDEKLRVGIDGKNIGITASFGIAMLEDSSDTPDVLIDRADEAMYKAKDSGRNIVVRSIKDSK